VLKFGDNLENGQNFNEIPKNCRGVARRGGGGGGGEWTLWEGVTPPIHRRFGKLFSDLSENCFRGERKYLSGSELKIMLCREKFSYFGKKFRYVRKNFCILGKTMILGKEILICDCSDSAKLTYTPPPLHSKRSATPLYIQRTFYHLWFHKLGQDKLVINGIKFKLNVYAEHIQRHKHLS
jgi:hypothetical protein